jgi:CheY-like chemotaxis protein
MQEPGPLNDPLSCWWMTSPAVFRCLPPHSAASTASGLRTVKPADALKIAQDRKPHLVLLDVMMPEMDGFTLCRHLP